MSTTTRTGLALFDMTGRVALVTGGSKGLGLTMASGFASAGADVVLVSRHESEAQAAAKQVADTFGHRAIGLKADVTNEAEVASVVARTLKDLGRIDVLVNNAGINIRKPFLDLTPAEWDAVLAINLDAPFLLTQALAPAMIARRWGRVIHIASLQSVRAFPMGVPYGASKGGIAQLTRAQAQALSPHGVTVNAIAPGFFATALTAPVVEDRARWDQMARGTFNGRNGELSDLRGPALFLASPACDYVTGQVLFVDGGFSAG